MPAVECDPLFTPAQLGSLTLKNRIVYPAMTRARCVDRVVGPENIKYYAQRGGAGLIITEPSSVSPQANGFADAPGMYTRDHMIAWSKLTEKLHDEGCTIVAQLWHTGRMSHSSFNDGEQIVAASAKSIGNTAAVPACGVMGADGTWHNEHEMPRELTGAEAEGIVEDFGKAAALAVEAGFDGVEIHAASGYLIDTFLQSCSNERTDKYGGDADGRFQILREVVRRVSAELPVSAIGVKLSPNSGFNGMGSADNHAAFLRYAALLNELGVGYIHVQASPIHCMPLPTPLASRPTPHAPTWAAIVCAQDGVGTNAVAASWFGKVTTCGFHDLCAPVTAAQLSGVFRRGGIIGNGGYTAETASAAVGRGDATAISFGRIFMSNPDLVERIRDGRALEPLPPKEAWFDPSPHTRAVPSWGYTESLELSSVTGLKRGRRPSSAEPSSSSEHSWSDGHDSASASDGDDVASTKTEKHSPRKLKILHVCGSPVSQYYSMISVHYARQMIEGASDVSTRASFDFHYAVVLPGGAWCMTTNLDQKTIDGATKLSHGQALTELATNDFDACVPHMFCWPGYTSYRAVFDMLGVPLVGNSPECMALITDKAQAKAVCSAAGVPVPQGELLRSPSQKPTVPFPYVLKPCCEDNSMGITKVDNEAELPAALAEAFKFDSTVVCERFIPLGREIRVAVIEGESGEPETVLPATEYLLTPEHPMRTSTDKISVTDSGLPDADKFFATNHEEAPSYRRSICPAPLDDKLALKLATAAKVAHKALRCRDFSIYDFRVDPEGEVYMLECQPVCSFARESAMIGMALKTDAPELQHPTLYHRMLRKAAARKPKPYDGSQVLGMKAQQ